MPQRRHLVAFILAALSVTAAGAPAWPQDYPLRPIRMIVSSPAGSLVDVLSRLLTQELGAQLGQSVVVDNRAGAMTQIAIEALVRAPPDGYTSRARVTSGSHGMRNWRMGAHPGHGRADLWCPVLSERPGRRGPRRRREPNRAPAPDQDKDRRC
jgi:tripartite-type tricarboxylate transporter receptor subunit TctC